MIVSNVSVSLSGCAGVNSALCAGAGEGQPGGGSHRTTLTPTGNLVVAVCLGFIGTLGLLNNLLVLVLFFRYKMLRSPINLLLINISISDLLVCVLGTPFSFAASTQGRWLIGEAGCIWYGFANSLFGEYKCGLCEEMSTRTLRLCVCGSAVHCVFCVGCERWCAAAAVWILPTALRLFQSMKLRFIVWNLAFVNIAETFGCYTIRCAAHGASSQLS